MDTLQYVESSLVIGVSKRWAGYYRNSLCRRVISVWSGWYRGSYCSRAVQRYISRESGIHRSVAYRAAAKVLAPLDHLFEGLHRTFSGSRGTSLLVTLIRDTASEWRARWGWLSACAVAGFVLGFAVFKAMQGPWYAATAAFVLATSAVAVLLPWVGKRLRSWSSASLFIKLYKNFIE